MPGIKGAQRLSANGSWVIPEVSKDYVSWQTYEAEFRARAGITPGSRTRTRADAYVPRMREQRLHHLAAKPQPWDFYRPCTILELGAGGNMAAAMAIAKACRAPPPA
ncbi:hypothetical protein FRC10_004443 [Ceratobasidium sp. 414]|nr:hypothetical protein FRC10_004443 [Ceratobasidium sp. 414]